MEEGLPCLEILPNRGRYLVKKGILEPALTFRVLTFTLINTTNIESSRGILPYVRSIPADIAHFIFAYFCSPFLQSPAISREKSD